MKYFHRLRVESDGPLGTQTHVYIDDQEVKSLLGLTLRSGAGDLTIATLDIMVVPSVDLVTQIEVEPEVITFDLEKPKEG